jgi:lipid-A-disaccharide synthase
MALLQIMVVAGEASGDQHAADLVAQLRQRSPHARFFGMGGSRLAAEGLERIHDADEVSVMGIVEVLPKLRRILQVMASLERAAKRRRPRCAILVDIPDFNLRLARRLKSLGIPVVYFISPMLWAWRPGRIESIAQVVDLMLCILPFEEALYRRAGVRARYVGNPVLDQVPAQASVQEFRSRLGLSVERPTLTLLPGSREAEVRRILAPMIDGAKQLALLHQGLQVVVPIAPSIDRGQVRAQFEDRGLNPELLDGQAPQAIGAADVAVVASGTATLEAALMGRPFVVVYKLAPVSYAIARLLVRVPHIALVNLIAGKRLVPELLQGQLTPQRLCAEVERIWSSASARQEMTQGLAGVRSALGGGGAAGKAADEVLAFL